MTGTANTLPIEILRSAKYILLVDWPNPGVPTALLQAGFTVFSYSPGGYSNTVLINDDEVSGKTRLVFNKIDGKPGHIDIVNVYRPEKELPGITEEHVLPLGATTVWLHPPVSSDWAAGFARDHGLNFVEGMDIAELAKDL